MTRWAIDRAHYIRADRMVASWIIVVALLVLAIIILGGATRLTDSGLSITEWKPIVGAIPPLSSADWQEAFEKYKEIPEYHRVNKDMDLAGFKFIFWWEWAHRFLGRIIGLAFAIPLAVFWWRGDIRPGFKTKLAGVLALGALQGAIGWYMVSSGLVDRVDVSQYRLALHLSVAFLILAALVWLALDLWPKNGGRRAAAATSSERAMAGLLVAAIFVQVVLGAFVAGLDAGRAFNTWPDMNGAFVPPEVGTMSPLLHDLFGNIATVQFNHRMMAYAVAALAFWNAWIARDADPAIARSALLVATAVLVQIALGIWTLLQAVPLSLGLLHQGMAALLFALAVRHLHLVARSRPGRPYLEDVA